MADKHVVTQLISLLTQANAHVTFEDAVSNIPFELLGKKPHNLPHSIWMLVEHIRIAQADILNFSTNEQYKALSWPAEYWPGKEAPETEKQWQYALEQVTHDKQQFLEILSKDDVDLYSPFPYGDGQNLLREALLIADHNSYHTGQIVLIRRLLGNWD